MEMPKKHQVERKASRFKLGMLSPLGIHATIVACSFTPYMISNEPNPENVNNGALQSKSIGIHFVSIFHSKCRKFSYQFHAF